MWFFLPAPIPALAVSVADASFTGAYAARSEEGEALLTLKQDASGRLSGTLAQGAIRLTLQGQAAADGQSATGTAAAGGAPPLRFTLRREDSRLQFRLLDEDGQPEEEIAFAPAAASRPTPARPAPKTPAPAPKKPTLARRAPAPRREAPPAGRAALEKTYRHPIGVSFRYPDDWSAQEGNGILVLLPPGFQQGKELFLAAALPAGGIERADDPRVTQAVDALAMQQGMRRTGSETLPVGASQGTILQYEGTLLGLPAIGRAYVTFQKGYCLYFVALAEKSRLPRREGAVRRMFASLAMGEAQRDPRLVGAWIGAMRDNGRTTKGADGRTAVSLSGNSQDRFVLGADGTIVRTTWSQMIASTNVSGADSSAGYGITDTGDRYATTRGTWSAADGRFSVLWEDGLAASGAYQLTPGGAVIRLGNQSLTLTRN